MKIPQLVQDSIYDVLIRNGIPHSKLKEAFDLFSQNYEHCQNVTQLAADLAEVNISFVHKITRLEKENAKLRETIRQKENEEFLRKSEPYFKQYGFDTRSWNRKP